MPLCCFACLLVCVPTMRLFFSYLVALHWLHFQWFDSCGKMCRRVRAGLFVLGRHCVLPVAGVRVLLAFFFVLFCVSNTSLFFTDTFALAPFKMAQV